MKKPIFIAVFFALFAINNLCYAQDTSFSSKFNIGTGLGIDYGGAGARLTHIPVKYLSMFIGIGYNLLEAGFNIGVSYRMKPDSSVCPYASFMYGYNAVIIVTNLSSYSQTYYGPSAALGLEIHSQKRRRANYFNIEVVFPFRSKEYRDDLDYLTSNPDFTNYTGSFSISFSIGYHFKIFSPDVK